MAKKTKTNVKKIAKSAKPNNQYLSAEELDELEEEVTNGGNGGLNLSQANINGNAASDYKLRESPSKLGASMNQNRGLGSSQSARRHVSPNRQGHGGGKAASAHGGAHGAHGAHG